MFLMFNLKPPNSVAYAGKNFGGFKVMAGLVWGPRAEPPGRRRIFENLQKEFLRKLPKMHYFSIFFKRFNKPYVNFSRLWTKNTICWEILRNFRKFSKDFLENLENSIILAYFSKNLTNNALIFRAFGRKLQILGKF